MSSSLITYSTQSNPRQTGFKRWPPHAQEVAPAMKCWGQPGLWGMSSPNGEQNKLFWHPYRSLTRDENG
ncbi:hypothetical protein Taro_031287 [Colocasia esculenta]|uniref:Uncharacterized protein n=1 Tax=Colocasia esculenta TaxID=4460 RepID=A0A843VWB6_COLES|nr:hypothetical protein [Colocasia esculenta]